MTNVDTNYFYNRLKNGESAEQILEDIANKIQEAVMTSYPNGFAQKEMGKVIKEIKSIYPTADGKLISEVVKKHII